MKAVYYI